MRRLLSFYTSTSRVSRLVESVFHHCGANLDLYEMTIMGDSVRSDAFIPEEVMGVLVEHAG